MSQIVKRAALTLAMVLLPVLLVSEVGAAGSLYINPANVPGQAAGSLVEYQVKVADIGPFTGWDIRVQVNPNAIFPETISLETNLLTANFSARLVESVHCVNGSGQKCTIFDGPGIIHSAAEATGSTFNTGTASGLLFSITYRAQTNPSTTVAILDDQILFHANEVAHITFGATYGQSTPPGPIVGGILAGNNSTLVALYGSVALAALAASFYVLFGRRKGQHR